MDNQVFNVNGAGREFLGRTIALAFEQGGNKSAEGYAITPDAGMVLLWHVDPEDPDQMFFPATLGPIESSTMVWAWLANPNVWERGKWDRWDEDREHDGHNSKGFRVYLDGWGHVGKWEPGGNSVKTFSYSLCAILPAYMWHGK